MHAERRHTDRTGRLELCNIAYNIGAAIAYQAVETFRAPAYPERMPECRRLFEEAAGAFHHIRTVLLTAGPGAPLDPSRVNMELRDEALSAVEALMLAHALRCFYERAREDAKSAAALARIAHQVAAAYAAAAAPLRAAAQLGPGPERWLGAWAECAALEGRLFLAAAHEHAADDPARTAAAAAGGGNDLAAAHLLAAEGLLAGVASALAAGGGGGRLLRAQRRDVPERLANLRSRTAGRQVAVCGGCTKHARRGRWDGADGAIGAADGDSVALRCTGAGCWVRRAACEISSLSSRSPCDGERDGVSDGDSAVVLRC